MNNLFLIQPELHELTKLLKVEKTLPSIQKLAKILNTTNNKIRTFHRELLYFKFIYSQSSSGYGVNTWTTKLLNCNYHFVNEKENFCFYDEQKIAFIKFNKEKFITLFKKEITENDNLDACDLLYFFLIMARYYRSINENQIFINNNNLVLNVNLKTYKTEELVCSFQHQFDDTMNWYS